MTAAAIGASPTALGVGAQAIRKGVLSASAGRNLRMGVVVGVVSAQKQRTGTLSEVLRSIQRLLNVPVA